MLLCAAEILHIRKSCFRIVLFCMRIIGMYFCNP